MRHHQAMSTPFLQCNKPVEYSVLGLTFRSLAVITRYLFFFWILRKVPSLMWILEKAGYSRMLLESSSFTVVL